MVRIDLTNLDFGLGSAVSVATDGNMADQLGIQLARIGVAATCPCVVGPPEPYRLSPINP